MGLISKIKGMFNKDINLPKNANGKLISIANPNGVIKIGQNLVVPDNYAAIIITKGKVCDIFTKGEYELETGIIQKSTRVRKLMKPDRRGNFPKRFDGYIYYVNLAEFNNQDFESCYGVIVKEKKLFSTVVGLKGKYSFKINNPKKLMQVLIKEYYALTGELPEKQIMLWIGEVVDKFVENKKLSLKYFLNNNELISEGLLNHSKKEFEEIGVEVLDVKITECELSKKIKKKIDSGKLFIDGLTEYIEHEKDKNEKLSNIVIQETNQQTVNIQNILNNSFEDNLFENDNNQNIEKQYQQETYADFLKKNAENIDKNNKIDYPNIENEFKSETNDIENQFAETEKIIDEYDIGDGEVITAEVIKFKKCSKCGANISGDSEKCFNCGEEIGKTCNVCGSKLKKDDFVCSNCGAIIF